MIDFESWVDIHISPDVLCLLGLIRYENGIKAVIVVISGGIPVNTIYLYVD